MHVVVIGSGVAGITFAEELRKLGPQCTLSIITREGHGYYSRPMLSHGFSREDIETKIILKPFDSLRDAGIAVHAETEVLSLDRARKTITCRNSSGEFTLNYDKTVLAPGSDALIPPPFQTSRDLFFVVNSLDDLIELRRHRESIVETSETPSWAVIGGGLIGCEVASDLAKAGDRVVLFHALARLMERQLAEEDSMTLLKVLQDHGIEIRLDAAVQGFEKIGESYAVKLQNEVATGFHGVIVACGFKPRVELARRIGLNVNRGIRVDAFLRTNDPDIHAIGDAAEFADGRLYAYIMPIRHQAFWLARFLAGQTAEPWLPPDFKPRAKVHGFNAAHPYIF
ncbi:rubredoxin--NAD(+) reductase [Methylocaldum marinum]|uniref:Rubredoxin--NAD(+) reductase n=1 Tax=Methylocaldum marinum TaxID=1432792 RepID=A0A250KQQ8_9GAMM|nr:FAD-dependent oxidoreductase [Methylocaldum marinum]BBA33311.1 rubredoxin--NAD(+) reductase [Methylocaldum marinum]